MAYRYGNRKQKEFFPTSIEEYVKKDDPVRVYDAFVESVNLKELGIKLDSNKVGNPEYNPKSMLKLLVYGYSYGFRSSRKLERAIYHNVSFIWLMEGLKPDHKTIANFRKNNKEALKEVFKQCARLCVKLKLIEGNTLFIDGSKIRANAAIKNSWTKAKCKKYLRTIDKRIAEMLNECDNTDKQEQSQKSLVGLEKELQDTEDLKSRVKQIMKELEDEKSINTTDKECTRINSVHGSHAGYNAQITVDEKHGLIINTDVVSENNDVNQFANQVKEANKILDKKCDTACADSGYANTDKLEEIHKENIKVIVPSQRQASKKEPKEFDKENFQYDVEQDCYICPEGHRLRCQRFDRKQKSKKYLITSKKICFNCKHYENCTKSQKGRSIERLNNEEKRKQFEAEYKQPESQDIYKLRQQKVELPFGHIKRNLGVRAFLLRGLDGVNAEMSLLTTCFNISRMITILGIPALIKRLMC
ncbi:MAG: IS1182 family transposase [Candidatus Omnitrophota bacterium]